MAGGKGGTKKHGRNKDKCDAYRKGRRVRNKLTKLKKHLAAHINDEAAKLSLSLWRKAA